LELDLQELDPISSAGAASPNAGQRSRHALLNLGSRIPLRNLRAKRLINRRESEEEDDLEGLLHGDEDATRNSAGSHGTSGDDDAPLLPSANRRPRQRQSQGALSRIGSKLRLASFMSSMGPGAGSPGRDPLEPDEDGLTEHDPASNRTVAVGQIQSTRFPPNAVSNAKYTPWSFLPRTLYNEFSFFINMYFLLVALSQIIPPLRIGYWVTYIAPLAFVISITLGKEAFDDIARRRRDAEANSEGYTVLKFENHVPGSAGIGREASTSRPRKQKSKRSGHAANLQSVAGGGLLNGPSSDTPSARVREIVKPSKDLKIGDVVKLAKDQRVPADMILLKTYATETANSTEDSTGVDPVATNAKLINDDDNVQGNENSLIAEPHVFEAQSQGRSSDTSGEAFIRTDQLDGETDWKLRLTTALTQTLSESEFTRLRIVAGKPDKRVNEFVGTLELLPKRSQSYDSPTEDQGSSSNARSVALTIDNTAWANTVLASSCTVLGVVIYTGSQTRQALSTSPSRSKTGLLEYEINSLTKILCILTLALSFVLVALQGFATQDGRKWYISTLRFLILFSTIVPVSLRVNLDLGKTVYAWFIERDRGIPGTVVRTSTIPEDLGRVEYLLSDKTGTLTQNGSCKCFLSPLSGANLIEAQRWR
jgi:phospholipid-translocating ATPase